MQKHTINYSYGMNMFSKLKSIRWDHFDILELPYAGVDLSIFILLPVNGIEDAEKYFQIFNLKEVIAELSIKSNYWTEVTMPRFTVSFDWNDLSEVMKTSGVESLFDKQSANLTNISDDLLYVTKVNKFDCFHFTLLFAPYSTV